MNRRELVAALAERTETDKRSADAALQAFIDIVTETVASGEPVAITGFAKFARVERAARMGRNPQTGEAIRIKASRRVRVTPLKAFKDAVLTGKPAKKATAKKTVAKKAPAKKVVAKRAPAKKVVAKRAPAKKVVAKRAVAKTTTAKKTTAKKTTRR
jgi:DNA-binding protein HU-beta